MSARIVNGRFAISARDTPKPGGSSLVYKAIDIENHETVALKLLTSHEFTLSEVGLFFHREKDALLALQHPNIVQLVDAGQDGQTGQYYLALEWVDTDLPTWLGAEVPEFDNFIEDVAIPVAQALAFAHKHDVVHRDVKPSNVLIGEGGVPKLADFGISKLKNTLTGGPLTAAQFGSRPYAAPERDGTSSYARDVFGFGVLILRCLTGRELHEYEDIQPALDALDVRPNQHDLIRRCVADRPEIRPSSGVLLCHELERIQQPQVAKRVEQQTVHLKLTRRAQQQIEDATGLADWGEVKTLLEDDVNEAPSLKVDTPFEKSPDRLEGRRFFLAGSKWSLGVKLDDQAARPRTHAPGGQRLAVIGATDLEPGDGDRRRELNFNPSGFRFSFDAPLNHERAYAAIKALVTAADEYEFEREQQYQEREDRRLFEQWGNQLNAREAVEGGKEAPLRYKTVEQDRRRATFTVTNLEEQELAVEEYRRVMTPDHRALPLKGVVEAAIDDRVTLYLDAEYDSIPSHGFLVRDTRAARSVISRERDALSAVRYQGPLLARADLPGRIIHPETSEPPGEVAIGDDEWLQQGLDVDKKTAVRAALGSPDVFVVQGPPGTGKTTLITELIAQEVRRDPGVRILLASQTNVALDNALAKLEERAVTDRLIRIAGSAASQKVASEVQSLVLDKRLDVWRKDVRDKSTRYIQGRAQELGVDLDTVRAVLKLKQLQEIREQEARWRAEQDELREQIRRASDRSLEFGEVPVGANTQELNDDHAKLSQLLKRLRKDVRDLAEEIGVLCPDLRGGLDACTAEEARLWADTLLPENQEGAAQLRNLVALQGRWFDRLGQSEQFEAPLIAAMNVVAGTCVGIARAASTVTFDLAILDEASKATATEALVPLVRAKRWVLVGDRQQLPPFQDDALRQASVQAQYELDPEELRHTLFGRLSDGVRAECSALLRSQHRMTEAIGELISQCFYNGQLVHDGPPPYPFQLALRKPVVWFSTSRLSNRSETRVDADAGPSYHNITEASTVINLLGRIDLDVGSRRQQSKLHVLVLAPYRPQVAAISDRVTANRRRWSNLDVEVNSVDAAQGREADVVVFSVTRSNPSGKLGFLSQEPRVNVALSRGRLGLVIVGDLALCASSGGVFQKVLQHIEANRGACAIEELQP